MRKLSLGRPPKNPQLKKLAERQGQTTSNTPEPDKWGALTRSGGGDPHKEWVNRSLAGIEQASAMEDPEHAQIEARLRFMIASMIGRLAVYLRPLIAAMTPGLVRRTGARTWSTVTLNDFANYTPTITPGAGAFTTVSGTIRWFQIGKFVFMQITVTITNVGTGTGNLFVTFPTAAASTTTGFLLAGQEISVTAKGVTGHISDVNTFAIIYDDGTSVLASGVTFRAGGCYEAA